MCSEKVTPLLSDFKNTKVECIKDLSSHPSSLGYFDKRKKMVKQGVLQSPCGKHKSTQAVFPAQALSFPLGACGLTQGTTTHFYQAQDLGERKVSNPGASMGTSATRI